MKLRISTSLLFFFLSFNICVFCFPTFILAEDPIDENIVTETPQYPETSTYKLQVGDSIVVTVEGYPEYSKDRVPVPVQPDGFISYPLIGLIRATGLTISELEAQMQKTFTNKLPSARVFVTLMQPKRNILVYGAVEQRPRGNLHVFETGQVYLLHALAAAGVNNEIADLTKITIWRDGKVFRTVNFEEQLNEEYDDIPLQDYDIVIVPSIYAVRQIRVIGAVAAPGLHPIRNEQVTADQALKFAGGSKTDFADLKKAEIITGEGNTPVDLTAENVSAVLFPGDILYVPIAEAKISVVGAVYKPGQYTITEPILLRDAVAMAGGLNEEKANFKKCLINRADGTQEELNFNLRQSEVYLNPNDQLRIMERIRIDWRVLSFAASLTNLVVSVWLRYR